jgi:TPR repeat protein
MKRLIVGVMILLAVGVAYGDGDELYKQGEAVYRDDPAKACALFVQAAEAGNVSAMVGAGHCFEVGAGSEINFIKAVEWYEKAVQHNSLKACKGLARIYASCPDPEFNNGEKAVKFATPVARKNPRDASSLSLLAAAHARNMEFDEALKVGKKAASVAEGLDESKKLKAQLECLRAGEPIPAKATVAWIMQATEAGSLWAIIEIAPLYGDPASDLYDTRKALALYQQAIDAGRVDQSLFMGDLYFDGKGEFLDLELAGKCYQQGYNNRGLYESLGREHRYRLKYRKQYTQKADYFFSEGEKIAKGYIEWAKGDEVHGQNKNGDDGFFRSTPIFFPPDPELARFLYQVAQKKRHPKAGNALRDLDKKPSDKDSVIAIMLLDEAMAHEKKSKGSLVDAYEALFLYFQSYCLDPNAKEGTAAYGLSRIYREGPNGMPKDFSNSKLWNQKAADAGNPEAMRR